MQIINKLTHSPCDAQAVRFFQTNFFNYIFDLYKIYEEYLKMSVWKGTASCVLDSIDRAFSTIFQSKSRILPMAPYTRRSVHACQKLIFSNFYRQRAKNALNKLPKRVLEVRDTIQQACCACCAKFLDCTFSRQGEQCSEKSTFQTKL